MSHLDVIRRQQRSEQNSVPTVRPSAGKTPRISPQRSAKVP
jgi:hypothetical protein